MNYKIGLGQDSHPVKKNQNNQPLILAGVLISKNLTVIADSDGDVVIHALCNALNTAIGFGSFSVYATPMCRSGMRDSREYLRKAVSLVKEKGYRVNNVAIMVETNAVRLENFRQKMSQILAKILEIKKDEIGMAFTSGEKLTAFGKGRGIQVFANVLLIKE